MPEGLAARALIPALLLAAPGSAFAQAAYCDPSVSLPRPRAEGAGALRRLLPIGGYTLALSWSPQYCTAATGPDSAFQCRSRAKFGFILHGLWPDGVGRDWPQYCRAADLLPRAVIRQNLCMTPSPQLMQHEWAKHGSCMTTRPDLYFNLARAFYEGLRFPDMTLLSRRKTLTVRQFTQAFAAANKGVTPEMVRVRTTRNGALEELWLCLDRAMEYVRCPRSKSGANPASLLRIEPGPNIRPSKPAPRRRPPLKLNLDPNAEVPTD